MPPLPNVSVPPEKDHSTITIGCSVLGRPLQVRFLGNARASLRMLIVAGQHGDEPLAREATKRFEHRMKAFHPAHWSLAILEDANPDGAAQETRHNAQNRDLNRDHQLLLTPEVQSLHQFIRTWQPHWILDVHTFAPRRKKLLSRNLVYYHSVLLDIPNNPSLTAGLLPENNAHFLHHVIDELNQAQHRSDRYVVLNPPDQFRYSVADILDARNGLTLRHQAMTVLLEGRQGKTQQANERTVAGLCAAMERILGWAVTHGPCRLPPLPSPGDLVSLRNRYEPTRSPKIVSFWNASETLVGEVDLTADFCGTVISTRQVHLPCAYAVPKRMQPLLQVLQRHGFVTTEAPSEHAEQYTIHKLVPSTTRNRAARSLTTTMRNVKIQPEEYVFFPVEQRGGQALAVFLEPESKYGLCRHPEADLSLEGDPTYPVLRIPTGVHGDV